MAFLGKAKSRHNYRDVPEAGDKVVLQPQRSEDLAGSRRYARILRVDSMRQDKDFRIAISLSIACEKQL